jgi:hypothetical protein
MLEYHCASQRFLKPVKFIYKTAIPMNMRRFIANLVWTFSDAYKAYNLMTKPVDYKEIQLDLLKRLDSNIKKSADHKKYALSRKPGKKPHKKIIYAVRQRYNDLTPIQLGDAVVYSEMVKRELLDRLLHPPINNLTDESVLDIPVDGLSRAIDFPRKKLKAVRINGIITERKRSQLEAYFSCPVYTVIKKADQFIAHSCKDGKLHYEPTAYIIEYLNNKKPALNGKLGEIFVTDLHSDRIIRYSTGLCGRQVSRCICGSSLPVIGTVEGESGNCISNRSHIITTLMPAQIVDQYDWLSSMCLIQNKKEITAEIEVCFKPTNNSLNRLTKDIAKLTHSRNIVLSVVKNVDPTCPIVGINPFNNY